MSIVRVGLGESKEFAAGYDAIFGKKQPQKEDQSAEATTEPKAPAKTKRGSKKSPPK